MKARLLLVVAVMSVLGCLGAQTAKEPFKCERPYLQVGTDCCLDKNFNNICDKDEPEPTTTTTTVATTVEEVKTTVEPTTTTTTIPPKVACRNNADCGQRQEKFICFQADVYKLVTTPVCRHPGTPQSQCITKERGISDLSSRTQTPHDKCRTNEVCVEGEPECKPAYLYQGNKPRL